MVTFEVAHVSSLQSRRSLNGKWCFRQIWRKFRWIHQMVFSPKGTVIGPYASVSCYDSGR